jgi:hypothetical protein
VTRSNASSSDCTLYRHSFNLNAAAAVSADARFIPASSPPASPRVLRPDPNRTAVARSAARLLINWQHECEQAVSEIDKKGTRMCTRGVLLGKEEEDEGEEEEVR